MAGRSALRWVGRSKFLRFAVIGTAAFFVDAAILAFAIHQLGLGPYWGRAISFLCAASFTWAMNRRFTFAESAATRNRVREWGKFLVANGIGGGVNYGVYALIVAIGPQSVVTPYLALAAGSLAGLAFNFLLSKHLVFTSKSEIQ